MATAPAPPAAAVPVSANPAATPAKPTAPSTAPSKLGVANALGNPPSTRPSAVAPAPQPVNCWKGFFSEWPADLPRRGVVITQLNEPIAFKAFMLKGDFVLLERTSPDSMGGRFLLVPYAEIAIVKFTDPLKQPVFDAAGFQGKLSS